MITMENLFEIISYSGSAKAMAYEAMAEASQNDFEKAQSLLKEADATLLLAHQIQNELIQSIKEEEARDISLLLIHAQDHMMMAMELRNLAEMMLGIYQKIQGLEEKLS